MQARRGEIPAGITMACLRTGECRRRAPGMQARRREIPAGSTIHKGSDSLRALFLWRFPGEARGSAAGDVAPEMPEMAYFWPGAVSVLRLLCG